MARLLMGAAIGSVVTLVFGAALGIRAQEDDAPPIPAETVVTAIRVGLDARQLHGAATSVGTDAVTYLQTEGLIPRVPVPAILPERAAAPPEPAFSIWDRLAVCESTSNWRANTGNGYFGGVQQDLAFWRRYGGLAFAPRPDLATRAQQIAIAERGLAVQGWRAWPACSRRLGLR